MKYFFLFYQENRNHEMSKPFFLEKTRKNNINLKSAENAQSG